MKLYQKLFLRKTTDSQHCPLWRRCMDHVPMLRSQQASPQCSRTILHAATSLKVLATFKEIRDIFLEGKEGLLPEVWQQFAGCICLHTLWGNGQIIMLANSIPVPLVGAYGQPQEPHTAAVTSAFQMQRPEQWLQWHFPGWLWPLNLTD